MKESNFLKEFRIATTFVQNFKDFQAKFDFEKYSSWTVLKNPFSISIQAIISHPHFLMGSYHLLSDVFQNKTIVGFSKI